MKRLYQIDLLRFIAAISVVMFHYTFRGYMEGGMSNLEFSGLAEYFKYGYLGVHLFFIISGFVIIMSAEKSNFKKFIKSRFIRLYPAFWVCLVITTLAIVIGGGKVFNVNIIQFFANTTMLNGFMKISHVDGVYWSLLVELKFYFLLSIVLLSGSFERKIFPFMLVWLGLTLVGSLIDLDTNIFFYSLSYILILDYSPFFLAGMTMYLIYKNGVSIRFILVLLVTYFLSLRSVLLRIPELSSTYNSFFSETVIIILVTIFFVVFFLISIDKLLVFNSSSFVKLGLLTYPLYLLHQNVGFIIFNSLENVLNKFLLLFLTTLFMVFAAYIINRQIEAPFSKWLKIKLRLI